MNKINGYIFEHRVKVMLNLVKFKKDWSVEPVITLENLIYFFSFLYLSLLDKIVIIRHE